MGYQYQFIRPETLLRAVGGERNALLQLLDLFVGTVPDTFLSLEHAAESGNQRDVCRLSHTLKSNFMLIGALELSENFNVIEKRSRYSRYTPSKQDALNLHSDVHAALKEVEICIKQNTPPPQE